MSVYPHLHIETVASGSVAYEHSSDGLATRVSMLSMHLRKPNSPLTYHIATIHAGGLLTVSGRLLFYLLPDGLQPATIHNLCVLASAQIQDIGKDCGCDFLFNNPLDVFILAAAGDADGLTLSLASHPSDVPLSQVVQRLITTFKDPNRLWQTLLSS